MHLQDEASCGRTCGRTVNCNLHNQKTVKKRKTLTSRSQLPFKAFASAKHVCIIFSN